MKTFFHWITKIWFYCLSTQRPNNKLSISSFSFERFSPVHHFLFPFSGTWGSVHKVKKKISSFIWLIWLFFFYSSNAEFVFQYIYQHWPKRIYRRNVFSVRLFLSFFLALAICVSDEAVSCHDSTIRIAYQKSTHLKGNTLNLETSAGFGNDIVFIFTFFVAFVLTGLKKNPMWILAIAVFVCEPSIAYLENEICKRS